ncbi:hypothetical protein K0M31_010420 [Melipona bicolor]|uniref:Uncharacterized protein n=1 Tax=Melipona bicolor TaxID=60889 RepID=A0AA40FLX8_9HYME|nr:hypothetical protein K0M31_010420 [Melipona bicolor]
MGSGMFSRNDDLTGTFAPFGPLCARFADVPMLCQLMRRLSKTSVESMEEPRNVDGYSVPL